MRIQVKNWEEFCPKHQLKNPWWFKWHNATVLSAKYLTLGQREIMALAYIHSLASEANNPCLIISFDHLSVFGRMKKEEFLEAIEILEENDFLEKIRRKSGQNPDKIRTVSDREKSARVEESRVEQNSDPGGPPPTSLFPDQRTYEPDPENGKPLLKKPKKAKAEVSFELLPEFHHLGELFQGKIPNAVQKMWLLKYGKAYVEQEISKAFAWNAKKGGLRTELNRFYGGWLQRSWEKGEGNASTPQAEELSPMARELRKMEDAQQNAKTE